MKSRDATIEIITHVVCWLVFLAVPLLFSPEPPPELKQDFGKLYFLPVFTSGLFLVALFYFNYFVLIPKLLFNNKYFLYLLSCVGCIAAKLIFPALIMFFFHRHLNPIRLSEPFEKFIMPFALFNSLLMYVVTILASIGLRVNKRWKLTEQEKLRSELSSLKSQVNPHFLFNTLNSIYAETLGRADNASEMILKLSDMMRYTIVEAHQDKVPLQKEFEYVTNYIELQKLRLPTKVHLEYSIRGEAYEAEIAPLVLIAFIENAFKHGVNSEQDSSIVVNLELNNNQINLSVRNNKVELEKTIRETTGLGVENTKKRLNLIYPGKHLLVQTETEAEYSVQLQIKLA